jgi:hypothetical protein
MKRTAQPMLVTIIFGMICGVAFFPMTMALSFYRAYWPLSFRLILWMCLVIYALLLVRWGKRTVKLIVFPLLLLFIIGFLEYSNTIFFILCLGVLSWIRSSVCFQKSLLLMLVTESAFSLGGGSLVAYFNPQTNLAWAMGIWMFFLVQSLYFAFWKESEDGQEEQEQELDPFERAWRQAEKLLSTKFSV